MKEFKPMLKLNLQHFATPTDPGNTTKKNKHVGILEKVTAANSYATPALISNDAIFMQGRNFTVIKGDTTELKDYDRKNANPYDNVQITEQKYYLNEEKYWGRFVDALDKRDTEGNIDKDYVVARQAAEVVAPYLDQLRFSTMARNKAEHLTLGTAKDATYNSVLGVSEKLAEQGSRGGRRVLFVSPSYYTKIKQYVVGLPQGDTNQRVLGMGVQGTLDGFVVVTVPSKFLQGVEAIATAGEVLASPIQADMAKENNNVPGRFGTLVEQLIYTGAFVPTHLQSKIFTIGGTEVTGAKDGEDVHAPEDTGSTT
ncbi:sugar-binding protein [Salinicoccus roseus]|uniref:sugar-binding protein n=1 Tax=Salinicoccus roseus TaxID=45670 RepID=UPI003524AD54